MWQFMERREILGAAAGSITFSGLDGEADEEYLLRYRIIHTTDTFSRQFALRPNGLIATIRDDERAGGGGQQTFDRGWVVAVTSNDYIQGEASIWAAHNWRGTAVAHERVCISQSTSSTGSSSVTTHSQAGVWRDSATLLSSLVLASSVVGSVPGTGAYMDVGTVAELWRRT